MYLQKPITRNLGITKFAIRRRWFRILRDMIFPLEQKRRNSTNKFWTRLVAVGVKNLILGSKQIIKELEQVNCCIFTGWEIVNGFLCSNISNKEDMCMLYDLWFITAWGFFVDTSLFFKYLFGCNTYIKFQTKN